MDDDVTSEDGQLSCRGEYLNATDSNRYDLVHLYFAAVFM